MTAWACRLGGSETPVQTDATCHTETEVEGEPTRSPRWPWEATKNGAAGSRPVAQVATDRAHTLVGDGPGPCSPLAAADGSVVFIWRAAPQEASAGRGGGRRNAQPTTHRDRWRPSLVPPSGSGNRARRLSLSVHFTQTHPARSHQLPPDVHRSGSDRGPAAWRSPPRNSCVLFHQRPCGLPPPDSAIRRRLPAAAQSSSWTTGRSGIQAPLPRQFRPPISPL